MSLERVLELNEEIEKAKINKAKMEGALKQHFDRMKEEFGCKTISEAKKKLNTLKKEKEELEEELEDIVEKLESEYEW